MTSEGRYQLALTAYSPKIRHFSRQHFAEVPGMVCEDFEQEMRLVLWRVVESYDPNKGARFNTLFWQCVRNQYVHLLRKAQADKRKSEWFDYVEDYFEEDDISSALAKMEQFDWQQIDGLTPEDWCLLRETVIERRQRRENVA